MLCLLAGAVVANLGTGALTLTWRHSVEKILWAEDWRQVPDGLSLDAARVRGSGAGMDPPPEAVLRDGSWTWHPRLPVLPEIVLRRSGYTADYRVCRGAQCRPMSDFVGMQADPVTLKPCPPDAPAPADPGAPQPPAAAP